MGAELPTGPDLLTEFGNYLRHRYDHMDHEWISETAMCDAEERLTCSICGATRTENRRPEPLLTPALFAVYAEPEDDYDDPDAQGRAAAAYVQDRYGSTDLGPKVEAI